MAKKMVLGVAPLATWRFPPFYGTPSHPFSMGIIHESSESGGYPHDLGNLHGARGEHPASKELRHVQQEAALEVLDVPVTYWYPLVMTNVAIENDHL